jgi:Flp pilus assembly protein TadG
VAKRRSGERGQGLVELAVILPLLLLIVMGAVDFGRAYFAYETLVNAAREGAYYASLDPTATTAGAAGAVNAEFGTSLVGVTSSLSPATTPRARGSQVTVTVTYNFRAVTAAVLGTSTFPLRASATMVVQ